MSEVSAWCNMIIDAVWCFSIVQFPQCLSCAENSRLESSTQILFTINYFRIYLHPWSNIFLPEGVVCLEAGWDAGTRGRWDLNRENSDRSVYMCEFSIIPDFVCPWLFFESLTLTAVFDLWSLTLLSEEPITKLNPPVCQKNENTYNFKHVEKI